MTRRWFQHAALFFMPLVYGAGFISAAFRYLSPLPRKPRAARLELEEKAAYFAAEGARPVEVQFNERTVFVLHDGERVRAFDAMCTHLRCNVKWADDTGGFRCPCHGARFDRQGRVTARPAPLPLQELEIAPIGADGTVIILDRYVKQG